MSVDPLDDRPAERAVVRLWRSIPLIGQLGPVAAGLIVLGLGSFAYLTVTGRALGPVDFAPVATLWVIFNAAGLALFQPIEQEVSRATAARRAVGEGARPVLAKASTYALAAVVLCGLVALAGYPLLREHVFAGDGVLVPILVLGLVGLASEHVLRGVFGGNERFGRYGSQLGIDGALRIVGPLLLAVTATTSVFAFGLALVLAPLLAAALSAGPLGDLGRPGPALAWRDILPPLLVLTGGAVLSQLIVNAAPIAAQVLAEPGEAETAGIFISALVMTRIPLFFFGAVQAAFLPTLARLAAQGQRAAFARQLRQVLLLVTAVGGLFVLVMAVMGPFALRLLYGEEFVATRAVLVPLAVAAALYMVAQVMAQTLIALRAYRSALIGWGAGSAVFALALLVPSQLELRVGAAFLLGSLVALVVLVFAARSRQSRLVEVALPEQGAVQ
ncbi:lipopolysaccharide biosynthesis protein [Geodermatophilus amargosae]|uniref:lipopolysaccharide biosynthesis protein n=1 Tax=Geodermatophilus amargosae TaxID=1296565 RepID=UPI0034DFADFE